MTQPEAAAGGNAVIDSRHFAAALEEELGRVNGERMLLRAALNQQAETVEALKAAHAELERVNAELERVNAEQAARLQAYELRELEANERVVEHPEAERNATLSPAGSYNEA